MKAEADAAPTGGKDEQVLGEYERHDEGGGKAQPLEKSGLSGVAHEVAAGVTHDYPKQERVEQQKDAGEPIDEGYGRE
ncbi:hypothetical protein F183_A21920 [Bryobacterales bacterium F-183]|nr:hypothetical protein F183_A21920 [Bryobacterales bacterium F-183]